MKTIYLILFWSCLSMVSFNHVLAQSIPTKIFLDKETVEDGTPANTPIATISTDLPHLDDTFIFEVLPYLNDPEEYPDYEYFKIIGRTLYTAKEIFSPAWDWPDFFFIIRVTNSEDESFSAEFIIVIEYVNVAPKITELTSNTVPEKLEFDFLNPAFTIGEIVVTDPNPDDKHVVTIVDDGPESALFTVVKSIDPGTLAETFLLQTSHTFIYAEKNQYTLQFIACETGAEGLCSEPTSFDIFITTNEPQPPTGIIASTLSANSISLSWTNPAGNLQEIEIERSLLADEGFLLIHSAGDQSESWVDENLEAGTTYYYRLRSKIDDVFSDFSIVVSATTEEEPVIIPDPVHNLTATALSPFAIELQWNPLSEADQIILQRSLTGDENDFTELATLDGNASSYSDTDLTPATEYFYRARVILNGQESVYSGLAAATTLEDIEMVTIEGRILNPLGQPVKEVEIEVEGSASLQTMTDVNGRFQFDFPNNAPFRVIPSKSLEARPNNGISTLDIILVGRHILNLRPINDPFLILAADVNKDNNITAIDQMMMRNVLLGKTNAFVNQQLWRFMPASHNLAESMIFSPFIEDVAENGKNIDFTGIRLGDVNYSWNINAARTGFTGTLAFELREPEFTEREIFIPVYAENFSAISGFQFTLDWNPSDLQILAVKNAALNVHFHKPDNQSGIMSISFDEPGLSGRSLSDKDILFYLSVQKKSNANLNISSLQISTSLTEVMALDAELNLLNIELNHNFQSQPEPTGYALLQNHPNPVQDISHFVFEAAEEGLATVTIMDGIGRIVDRIEQKASIGYNSITWNKEKITLAIKPGVYLYKLEINDFQAVRRMSIK
ncbi:MAG: T9SS type A sorting domain-containing protein [Cyclobacteriaceae bacterium]|nr:T9SS type A sorting domain-containing protein [Cyclobacteriaceae bacterium]